MSKPKSKDMIRVNCALTGWLVDYKKSSINEFVDKYIDLVNEYSLHVSFNEDIFSPELQIMVNQPETGFDGAVKSIRKDLLTILGEEK